MSEARPRHTAYGIWLIIASIVGWWAAFQLTVEKFILLKDPTADLSCNVSVMIQCGKNLDSWQGEVFGFPNPILGLTGWMATMVMGVAILTGARFPRWFWAVFGAGVTFAFGLVVWLIAQSLYAPNLGVLCPWCMLTWSVTIPTFFATMVHLARNGTFTTNERFKALAAKAMGWVPLATFLAYALVLLLIQLRGLDLINEVLGLIF